MQSQSTTTSSSNQTYTAPPLRPMKHLDTCFQILAKAGLPISLKKDNDSTNDYSIGLLHELMPFGDTELNAIISVLRDIDNLNDIISENLDNVSVGERHVKIAKQFDSIRKDGERILHQVENGDISTLAKIQNRWMEISRGDIPSRFKKIEAEMSKVLKESSTTLERMSAINAGYQEARLGLQSAVMMAEKIRNKASDAWKVEQDKLGIVLRELEAMDNTNPRYNERILARDAQSNVTKDAENRFQIAEDLYNNLTTAYTAGDVIMIQVGQVNDVHKRVYAQSQSFFSTNKLTLSGLNISHTAIRQMHQATQSLNVLRAGVDENLRSLGKMGSKMMEAGVRAGYGPSISAEAIRDLISNIIDHQEKSVAIKEEMRKITAENTVSLHKHAEEGRTRLAELIANGAAKKAEPSSREVADRLISSDASGSTKHSIE